jgi:signal transduction histidine kinase
LDDSRDVVIGEEISGIDVLVTPVRMPGNSPDSSASVFVFLLLLLLLVLGFRIPRFVLHHVLMSSSGVSCAHENDHMGQPIGVIGDPMQFGLSHYAIGIRQDIPHEVTNTISYWMNILMTCNPHDPEGPCPEGNFASMYEGRGGTGEECGYELYPSTNSRLLPVSAIVGIAVACTLALLGVFVVWHRHRLYREKRQYSKRSKAAMEQAEREREFNEFMAHEIRNPLASALAALSFVSSRTGDPAVVPNEEQRALVNSDLRVIDSSLQFVNDLLRNMLDVHRTQTGHGIKLHMVPTDVMGDIFEPISTILFMRGADVDVQTICDPENLLVRADRMRLKQILMNLSANATKFVTKGYIRLRAAVECVSTGTDAPPSEVVVLYVEDSGPGIPLEKQKSLFMKFQDSLDVLNQGTGIGLAVCKNLSDLMGASLTLQADFDSGIPGCPGTCFRLQLAEGPLQIDLTENDASGNGRHRLTSSGSKRGSVALFGATDDLSCTFSAELPESLSVL